MSSSLSSILLARVGASKKFVHVGRYNCMDAMRAILAVLESFGMAHVVYDQCLHKWFRARQSRKYRSGVVWTWDAGDIDRMVARLRSSFKHQYTVTFGTVQVLLCETRQAVNKYGIRGVWYLIRGYKLSSVIRGKVSRLRASLMKTSGAGHSHTLQILECIRRSKCLSVEAVRRSKGAVSVNELVYAMGSLRLCPKVCLEAIPEWVSLRRCMAVGLVCAHRRPVYGDIARATSELGIVSRRCGRKYTKTELLKAFHKGMKKCTGLKRTWQELADDVSAAGGTPLYYGRVCGRAVRMRMTKPEMVDFLNSV